jgi:glycosyltransferase involved in cell wall biosynthesis/GT2 family glycosyltransferase
VRVSVVVPSYRRPDQLRACLSGLAVQTRPADEVLVVRRRDDAATRSVLADGVRDVVVDEPGLAAAMLAGLRAATGDVVALTDDDAVPRPDWVARIAAHFADPGLGVLGGRDALPGDEGPGTLDVGRVGRWGRVVGNHHLGRGTVRDVDVVKGANLAVRRGAAAVPVGLRGTGAQPHTEVALCGWAAARGWRIAYDPDLVVDHYPARRPAGDRRERRRPADVADEAYNLVAALLSGRPELAWRRAAYGLLVGDRSVPGLLRAAYALARADREPALALWPSLAGQAAALRDHARGRRLALEAADPAAEPIRVTLVAHDVHDGGGMERALAELVRRADRRVAFTVVSSHLATDLRSRVVRWKRVPVPRRPFPLRFAAFYVLASLRLRRRRGQLVHSCGAIVPNRVDVATVHLCHAGLVAATGGLAPRDGSLLRRLNTALTRAIGVLTERWTYRRHRAQALAVVSPELRQEVSTHYAAVPVVLTPNGVDLGRFRPDPEVRAGVRARHGVAGNETVALFVGGDWARKGLRVAIEALADAVRAGVATRLWVVGPGDEPRYRALAAGAGIADRVAFFGPRADTEAFYRAADLLVLPSLYETFSLAAHEAAAAGLPVVATPVSGVRSLVGDDAAGLLVSPSRESVSAALVRLARDPALARRLGAEGRRRVAGQTWDASVDEVIGVYRDLLRPAVAHA